MKIWDSVYLWIVSYQIHGKTDSKIVCIRECFSEESAPLFADFSHFSAAVWWQDFELDVSANAEGANRSLDPQGDVPIGILDGECWSAKRPGRKGVVNMFLWSFHLPVKEQCNSTSSLQGLSHFLLNLSTSNLIQPFCNKANNMLRDHSVWLSHTL